MRLKKSLRLPGAGRTRAWHYHGSHTSTSPRVILLHSYYMSTQTFPPPVYQKNCPNFIKKKVILQPFFFHSELCLLRSYVPFFPKTIMSQRDSMLEELHLPKSNSKKQENDLRILSRFIEQIQFYMDCI